MVVTNVSTRGTLEYFTGLEAPAEGRQPLIEDRRTLGSAIQYLVRLHDFIRHPHRGQLQKQLGAGWIVLAVPPRELGTGINYGPPARSLARKAGLDVVWQRGGISILKAPGEGPRVVSVGPAKVLWGGYLVGLVVVGVVLGLAAAGLSRVDRRLDRARDSR